ncbi:MAG: efflux RND transporter periplasmic adaptor subunit [Deltaproteobacteria bacterium]|nr:efflux RND transporter periplasmic adaptor subunit [Deltaproteobacteria bacterium]
MRALVFVVVVAACKPGADKTVDPVAAAAQPSPFARGERRVAATEQVGYVGVLAPRESIEVTAPFTSKIEKFFVKLGETVRADQPLAQLDARPLRDEIALARAALTEASVAAGAAASKYAMEARAFRAGVSSKASVDAAAFESGQAGAMVGQHRTKISQLEQRLKDTKLSAKIGGKVALRYVEEGARVQEGQAVIRVISSTELFVKFAIPGEDARKVAPGDAVEIRFDSKTTSKVSSGVVKTVSPELDPIAQMIVAEAELDEASAELQSGVVCRIVPKKK